MRNIIYGLVEEKCIKKCASKITLFIKILMGKNTLMRFGERGYLLYLKALIENSSNRDYSTALFIHDLCTNIQKARSKKE